MKRKEVQLQFDGTNSLLVINKDGKIRTLYTPFRVMCIEKIDSLFPNMWVYVEEVAESKNHQILFLIGNKQYSHKHFHIIIHF